MHAVEGGVASNLTDPRQRAGDASVVELCRALLSTVRLLTRRLDAFLREPLPEDDRVALEGTRARATHVLEALHRLVEAPPRVVDRRPSRATAFRRLGDAFSRATGTCVDVRWNGSIDALPAETVTVLFGVACEAFLNVERHARATVVMLTLHIDDDRVVLELRDDGLDLAHREAYDFGTETRDGLVAAAHLVREAGGRMAVTGTSPRGMRLVAVVPRG